MYEKKYKENINRGQRAEDKFKQLALQRKFNVLKSTLQQDMREHWDFEITKTLDTKVYKKRIDVKGIKKYDGKLTDEYVFIELQNVGGGKGWLYGKADGIAFEINDGFILVELTALQKKIAEIVDLTQDSRQTRTKKEPYIIYDRRNWNNKDKFVLITKSDLLSIKHWKWSF